MTVDVRKYVETNWQSRILMCEKECAIEHHLLQCEAEKYFLPIGWRGGFFIDLYAVWDAEWKQAGKKNKDYEITHNSIISVAFEIKPKIYSAGALLRQAHVQKQRLMALQKPGDQLVRPVVAKTDPLVGLFAELSERPFYTWDGSRLDLVPPNKPFFAPDIVPAESPVPAETAS